MPFASRLTRLSTICGWLALCADVSMASDGNHPSKLDRLMHAVAEHHRLRASLGFALNEHRVCVASNSEELIRRMREHFGEAISSAQAYDLMFVAIEGKEPELGLPFRTQRVEPRPDSRSDLHRHSHSDEVADIDGGRVVREADTGLQFLLGSDMTLAVGACLEHRQQIIQHLRRRCAGPLEQPR